VKGRQTGGKSRLSRRRLTVAITRSHYEAAARVAERWGCSMTVVLQAAIWQLEQRELGRERRANGEKEKKSNGQSHAELPR